MLFGWLDCREVDAFAGEVVAELLQRLPPAGVDLGTKKAVERELRNLDRLLLRTSEFARSRKLNLYKKARVGNRVKGALREAKYPEPFVEVVTETLVTRMALASREARSP